MPNDDDISIPLDDEVEKPFVPVHNYWKYLNSIDKDEDIKLNDSELRFISDLISRGEEFVNNSLSRKQERWLLDIHDRLF